MTDVAIALLVASVLCLFLTAVTALYAVRTLEKSRYFLAFAWDLIHMDDKLEEVYGKEGTE